MNKNPVNDFLSKHWRREKSKAIETTPRVSYLDGDVEECTSDSCTTKASRIDRYISTPFRFRVCNRLLQGFDYSFTQAFSRVYAKSNFFMDDETSKCKTNYSFARLIIIPHVEIIAGQA